MKKIQRQIALLLYLLRDNPGGGRTRRQIYQAIPEGYADFADSPAAARRRFERDKEDLRELGFPVEARHKPEISDDPAEQWVYYIDRAGSFFQVPDLDLDTEEILRQILTERLRQPATDLARYYLLQITEKFFGLDETRELVEELRAEQPEIRADILNPFTWREADSPRTDLKLLLTETIADKPELEFVYAPLPGDHSEDLLNTRDLPRRRVVCRGLLLRDRGWLLDAYQLSPREGERLFHLDRIRDWSPRSERSRPLKEIPETSRGKDRSGWHPIGFERHSPKTYRLVVQCPSPAQKYYWQDLARVLGGRTRETEVKGKTQTDSLTMTLPVRNEAGLYLWLLERYTGGHITECEHFEMPEAVSRFSQNILTRWEGLAP